MELHPKKNLIYFIYWNPSSEMLLQNLELMDKYIGLFDGQRIIKVAGGSEFNPVVLKRFPWLRQAEFVPNDPVLNEAVHFTSSLIRLPKNDDSITFYAHAKGVTREVNQALISWVHWLYVGNLDSAPNLSKKLFSGCFGKKRQASKQVPLPWHYSGSFYWFRTKPVLDRYSKKKIPKAIWTRWFTECFPAFLAGMNEAEFRGYSSTGKCKLYSEEFWKNDPILSDFYFRKEKSLNKPTEKIWDAINN